MVSVSEIRTRPFVVGALSPAFETIIGRPYLEILWAVRLVESHLSYGTPATAADIISKLPEGGPRTSVDIAFLLEDLRLFDGGVRLGYFSPEGDVELYNPITKRIRTEGSDDRTICYTDCFRIAD